MPLVGTSVGSSITDAGHVAAQLGGAWNDCNPIADRDLQASPKLRYRRADARSDELLIPRGLSVSTIAINAIK